MDKHWMQLSSRFLPEYVQGVEDFINFARPKANRIGRIRCPCKMCTNRDFKDINVVRKHLLLKGIDKKYTRWVHHGEDYEVLSEDEDDDEPGSIDPGCLEEMLADLQRGSMSHVMPLGDDSSSSDPRELGPLGLLFKDAKEALYPGCERHSKMDFLVKLLHLKTINLWSNKSFDMLLQLIKGALPAKNTLPNSHYEAKKYMRDIGLGYIPIHACKNDCMLFWKETEKEENCLVCGEPRYKIAQGKGKKIPHKVLRYFPLTSRL